MFLEEIRKHSVYPCKLQFYYIKVRFKGVKIIYLIRRISVMDSNSPRLCIVGSKSLLCAKKAKFLHAENEA